MGLTLHTLAACQGELAAPGPDGRRRSSATISKHRATLNSLLAGAGEQGVIDRRRFSRRSHGRDEWSGWAQRMGYG